MVSRGELWWANLADPVGSEPGFRRPVLVVQAEAYNQSRLRTLIVAPLTTNLEWANATCNVFLPTEVSGLPKPSVVQMLHLVAVDRTRLSEQIAELPESVMRDVSDGLRMVLQL